MDIANGTLFFALLVFIDSCQFSLICIIFFEWGDEMVGARRVDLCSGTRRAMVD